MLTVDKDNEAEHDDRSDNLKLADQSLDARHGLSALVELDTGVSD